MKSFLLLLMAAIAPLPAQTTPAKSVVGTVSAFRPESAEIEVKPDNGVPIAVKLSPTTLAQRIAPGQLDLKNAQSIQITDLALGDRVLVTLDAGGAEARRIVVMPATDIAKRNAADRLDWTRRGVAGIVSANKGNEITLKMHSLTGESQFTVTTNTETTAFKRYAPDSVKFADAKPSSLAEVNIGDQLRARGQKSADGINVVAEEVIFGTFLNRAGTITAINLEAHELTIKDLSNNKQVVVKFTADSQLKRMPDMAAMAGAMRGGPPPSGAAPAQAARPAAPPPTAAAAPPGRGGPPSPPGGARGPDINQMLETMPATKFEDLKAGETIVVSATKGARADQITAITFLANADMLVQLAVRSAGAGSGPAPSLAGLASSMSSIGP